MREVIDVLLLAALVGALAVATRWLRRRRSARLEREAIDAALPDVAELAALILGAGAGVTDTVQWLADRGPLPTRPTFAAAIGRTGAGVTLANALPAVVDQLGPDYRPLVSALISAVRDGVPTASLLLRLGDEARTARRQQQEQRARSLAVHSLFPLVFCSLPALLITTVVPLALVARGRL